MLRGFGLVRLGLVRLVCALFLASPVAAFAQGDLIVEKKTFTMPSYTTVAGATIKDVKIGWESAGTLICRSTPDERDMSSDAHHNCRFGQWFHKTAAAVLKNHPGYAEIGLEHERMHQYAATLLRASMDNAPISLHDYERFLTALKRLKLEIATVHNELQTALFNLDPLTGTPSRVGMLSNLREQLALAKRNHPCAIVMMDLDRFKTVNDNYGHIIGDKVLIAFAHYLMTHLRPYDKVYRYGGEEFLICLPDTDQQTASDIVERLVLELASLPFQANGKAEFHVTASFGLTALDPSVLVEQSIDRADKALYAAKVRGRNRLVVWDESIAASPAPSKDVAHSAD